MKKLLALVLCLVMVVSLFAGCGGDPKETTPSTTLPAETTAPTQAPVVAEPIPENPLYYYSFDDATGLSAYVQGEKAADSANTGATFDLVPTEHAILIAEGQGAVGNALYLDGKYGVKLDDFASLSDDSYTLSFWLNADRLSTYGPVVQLGRNIGHANTDATVTWLNVTKSTWGTNSADLFPLVWNRNSSIGTDINADGVWPWISAGDDLEHGKREWCLVTLVVDGNRYVADDSMERIGTRYYLNGELVFDASAEYMYYQGVAPEILTGDGVEGWIGINYWDATYKGFIDELYIFDEALTAGQVKSLFEAGNPPAEPVAPEYEWGGDVTEPTEPVLNAITPAEGALDTLGTTDRVLGWWSDNTAGYELAEGGSLTMKLNNYSNAGANWNNFVLCATNTPVTTDLLASPDNYAGYAEYFVVRADAFGWGDAAYAPTFEVSWTDWAAWLALMTDADVNIVLTRAGNTITIDFTFTGADGTVMTEKATIASGLTADAPCYIFVGGEGAYIELLSVE